MSTIFGKEMPPEQRRHAEWLRTKKICTLCQNQYTELDNFGTLLCHGYHPLPLPVKGVFRCCDQRVLPNGAAPDGCVPVDHTDSRIKLMQATTRADLSTSLDNDAILLMATLKDVNPKQIRTPCWTQNSVTSVWSVCRVDYDERHRRLNNNLNR